MRRKEEIFTSDIRATLSCSQKKGNKYRFEKGTRGNGRIPDKPDRPDSKKEKKSRCSEISPFFQGQLALSDEKERDYAKLKSLIAGLSSNGDKKKPTSIASGTGTVQDQTSESRDLYEKMNAGQTWNSAFPSQWSVSYTIGKSNKDVGKIRLWSWTIICPPISI